MMCMDGNEFNLYNDGNDTKQYDFSKISYVELLVKEDFEGISDIKTGDISENEVEIYGTSEFPGNEVKIVGQAFKVNKSIIPDGNFFSGDTTMVHSCYVVVARDYNELEKVAAILRDKKHAGIYQYEFHVDIDGTNSQKKDCGNVNSGLFIKCVLITIGVFIFIYIIVFMLTSRTYYKIVGEENR